VTWFLVFSSRAVGYPRAILCNEWVNSLARVFEGGRSGSVGCDFKQSGALWHGHWNERNWNRIRPWIDAQIVMCSAFLI